MLFFLLSVGYSSGQASYECRQSCNGMCHSIFDSSSCIQGVEASILIATLHTHLEPKILALMAGMLLGVGFSVGIRWRGRKRNGSR